MASGRLVVPLSTSLIPNSFYIFFAPFRSPISKPREKTVPWRRSPCSERMFPRTTSPSHEFIAVCRSFTAIPASFLSSALLPQTEWPSVALSPILVPNRFSLLRSSPEPPEETQVYVALRTNPPFNSGFHIPDCLFKPG